MAARPHTQGDTPHRCGCCGRSCARLLPYSRGAFVVHAGPCCLHDTARLDHHLYRAATDWLPASLNRYRQTRSTP